MNALITQSPCSTFSYLSHLRKCTLIYASATNLKSNINDIKCCKQDHCKDMLQALML